MLVALIFGRVTSTAGGELRKIESGRSDKLAAGINISFGSIAGKIQHE